MDDEWSGMCSRGYGGFEDAAGFWVLWFWYRVFDYVLLDQSDMFPGPTIPFALGLNVVALWDGCHVNYGAMDMCILVC